MKRRDFVKKLGLASAGSLVLPYILPSGRLFAATGTRVVNHVVFCLLAGGVRNIEAVQKAEGNLMPNLFPGTEPVSGDILGGMEALPPPVLNTPLLNQATLFKEFRYGQGPPGHFQGHTTAITGHYVNESISFNMPTEHPTVFEYYRKHNSPSQTALNAWWISNGIGENENLAFSRDSEYGPVFGANFFSPNYILPYYNFSPIDLCRTYSPAQKTRIDSLRNFFNDSFNHKPEPRYPSVKNSVNEREQIQAFVTQLVNKQKNGQLSDPWNAGSAMNGDMYNVFFAEKVIEEFKPELLVVNMTDVDVCHDNFTEYCNNLRKADYAVGHLWQTIQNTPGMANDTILIVAPEHGRNLESNSIVDGFGRFGIDHGDETAKEIFCLIAGPAGKVSQNQLIPSVTGQSIDLVPTIAHILGFYTDIPPGLLDGSPLYQAFL